MLHNRFSPSPIYIFRRQNHKVYNLIDCGMRAETQTGKKQYSTGLRMNVAVRSTFGYVTSCSRKTRTLPKLYWRCCHKRIFNPTSRVRFIRNNSRKTMESICFRSTCLQILWRQTQRKIQDLQLLWRTWLLIQVSIQQTVIETFGSGYANSQSEFLGKPMLFLSRESVLFWTRCWDCDYWRSDARISMTIPSLEERF